MTLKLDGTNTAANPGITGGDANTGLVFGTDEIKMVTGGTDAITVGSDQSVALASGLSVNGHQYPSNGALSNRNLVMNGEMQVCQRGVSVTGITGNKFQIDRWLFGLSALGTWTIERSTDAPDEFAYSQKLTCTTAKATPAANNYALLIHRIEGANLQHLKYGTSGAKDLVVSFWVKSNKIGNASWEMAQYDNTNGTTSKQFTRSYTINTINTWEFKKFTIPGDTAGAIENTFGIGVYFSWWLNSGSDFSSGTHSTPNWQAYTAANRNVANLGVGGAVNDYLAITGVQVEVGTNDEATPFEHKSHAQELRECQRYLFKWGGGNLYGANYSNTHNFVRMGFPVTMRDTPICTATLVNGTIATNYTNRDVYQQFMQNATNSRLTALEASAEI